MAINDLARLHSNALDEVEVYCREFYGLHPDGKMPVDVSVRRKEREHSTTEDGHKLPVSYELGIVYVVERKGMQPVTREEAVADLCVDPTLRRELDNPGFRTSCSTVITEAKMQVLARLQKLLHLKDEGIVGKLTYSQRTGESSDVTRGLLEDLAGGQEIPNEAYRIVDNFAAAQTIE